MLIRLLRWIKGYVEFQIKGRFPERFINICLKHGVYIFNAGPSSDGFAGSLLLSDYRCIRVLAKKARVTLRIKHRKGLPFLIHRYKNRKGLLTGAVLFFIIILLMQSFVWTVEINGTEFLSEATVRELLANNGLQEGAFKAGLNFHSIERKVMEEAEEISWMSINTIGTKVEVEIREEVKKPKIKDSHIPCNIKASKDGIILKMNVKEGNTTLIQGSAVIEGQLLISGIIKNSLDELFYVHAEGEVLAQTTESVTFEAKNSGTYREPRDVVKRHNLQFFWLKVPISLSSLEENYTSRVVCEKVCLNDTFIELGRRTQYCTIYEDREYTLSEEKAKGLLLAEDYLYRLFNLSECKSIAAEESVAVLKDKTIKYVKYTCVEDIALRENIIVN